MRAVILALLALLAVRPAQAQDVLRVGDQRGNARALMEAAGVLDGLPYRLDWSEFPAAAPLLEALNAGAIDAGGVGDAPFTFAAAAGAPVKAFMAFRNRQDGLAILVAPDSPTDLRGTETRMRRLNAPVSSYGARRIVTRSPSRAPFSGRPGTGRTKSWARPSAASRVVSSLAMSAAEPAERELMLVRAAAMVRRFLTVAFAPIEAPLPMSVSVTFHSVLNARGTRSLVCVAAGPTKTSLPMCTPTYTLTVFWILQRSPMTAPPSTNTFLPSTHASPMEAPVRTWPWCHTLVSAPMDAPSSTMAVGWVK